MPIIGRDLYFDLTSPLGVEFCRRLAVGGTVNHNKQTNKHVVVAQHRTWVASTGSGFRED